MHEHDNQDSVYFILQGSSNGIYRTPLVPGERID